MQMLSLHVDYSLPGLIKAVWLVVFIATLFIRNTVKAL